MNSKNPNEDIIDYKHYDLKREMLNERYLYKNVKIKEMLEDILKNIKYDKDLNYLFDEKNKCYIERYLLFKIQYNLGSAFDCDKTLLAKKFCKNQKQGERDTVFSLQSIWGQIIKKEYSNECIEENEYNYFKNKYGYNKRNGKIRYKIDDAQKYIYELENIEYIKLLLGNELYNALNNYAHYYHTLGNMSECPSSKETDYNRKKGFYKVGYDRIDLFLECLKSDNWQCAVEDKNVREKILAWFYSENGSYSDNVKRNKLEILIDSNLGAIDINDKEKLIKYLNNVSELIQKRYDSLKELNNELI